MTDSTTVRMGVRLPVSLVKRLDAEADKRVLGRDLLVRWALEWYVEQLEKQDVEALRP